MEALSAGKHVFVEKPLAINLEELKQLEKIYYDKNNHEHSISTILMVGFNRRFSPHIVKIKSLLENRHEPKSIVITINAGEIPADHWTQDREIGGGRIIGEGCHFVDLMRFLVGFSISGYQAMMLGGQSSGEIRDDKISINLTFEDGSFGTIHYLANGGKSFPKERIEVFCGGGVLQLDNFRNLRGFDWPGFKGMKLWRQDKGQNACAEAFVQTIRDGGLPPIAVNEIFEVSRVTIEIAESLR